MQNIGIIGSTGSVGQSAIEVISSFKNYFAVNFLAANSNYKLIAKQAKLVNAKSIVILNEKYLSSLKSECLSLNLKVNIYCGEEELLALIEHSGQNILVANNGIAALKFILTAIKGNNIISLANKEALVSAGNIINQQLQNSTSKIIPVDSEHNAIYQIISANSYSRTNINKLIITASGGPFYNKSNSELTKVTVKEALAHPNWSMGAEICVNSATLVNKALELIEAYYLFKLPKTKIEAIYHPQSLVHGIIAYQDSSFIMAAAPTSMQIPIAFALTNEQRLSLDKFIVPITKFSGLIFEEIRSEKLTAINLAKEALNIEGNKPCIFNVANEVAVQAFLAGKINFTNIINVIDYTLNKIEYSQIQSIADVELFSGLAIEVANKYINTLI